MLDELFEIPRSLSDAFSVSNYTRPNENENISRAIAFLCCCVSQTIHNRAFVGVPGKTIQHSSELLEAWHSIHGFPLMLYMYFPPILCCSVFLVMNVGINEEKSFTIFSFVWFYEWKFVFFQFNVVEWETHEKATLESKFQLERASSVLLFLRVTETPRQPLIFFLPWLVSAVFVCFWQSRSHHFTFYSAIEEIEGIEGE